MLQSMGNHNLWNHSVKMKHLATGWKAYYEIEDLFGNRPIITQLKVATVHITFAAVSSIFSKHFQTLDSSWCVAVSMSSIHGSVWSKPQSLPVRTPSGKARRTCKISAGWFQLSCKSCYLRLCQFVISCMFVGTVCGEWFHWFESAQQRHVARCSGTVATELEDFAAKGCLPTLLQSVASAYGYVWKWGIPWYTPNCSHLVGIMISKTIGYNGVHGIFRQTHINQVSYFIIFPSFRISPVPLDQRANTRDCGKAQCQTFHLSEGLWHAGFTG